MNFLKKNTMLIICMLVPFFLCSNKSFAAPGPDSFDSDSFSGMEFVFVPGGCYQMGDIFRDDGDARFRRFRDEFGFRSGHRPHSVCVGALWVGKYEVTQGEWEKVMGSNPVPSFMRGRRLPVSNVSWDDVQNYIRKLNAKTGKKFRLPTEAEWEYAARSGGKREMWAGTSDKSLLDEYAWYHKNANMSVREVGGKKPNGFGLFDMTGNVWEWCSDWFSAEYYLNSPQDNPQGPPSDPFGNSRIMRGGSVGEVSGEIQTMERGPQNQDRRDVFTGFRLVLSPAH